MAHLEIKISHRSSEVKTIFKDVEDKVTVSSLLDSLKQAKEETNQYLTTLVEEQKLTQNTVVKQANKRPPCEKLEGGNAAKRNTECSDGNEAADDTDSTGDDDDS